MAKKHLLIEWLSWLPYESGFINSSILKTSKDRSNAIQSLKLLELRVHESVGGPLNTLLDNVVGSPPPPLFIFFVIVDMATTFIITFNLTVGRITKA